MPSHRNEAICSGLCPGSVWSQAANTSPLINLCSCSHHTSLGFFNSYCLFSYFVFQHKWISFSALPTCIWQFCLVLISDGSKSSSCASFFYYSLVLVNGQEFSHRGFFATPSLHLTRRSAFTCFAVWHCGHNPAPLHAHMLYFHVICKYRTWFSSVPRCIYRGVS